MKPVKGARVRIETLEHSKPELRSPHVVEGELNDDLSIGNVQIDGMYQLRVESFRQVSDKEWGLRLVLHERRGCFCCTDPNATPWYGTCRLTVLSEPQS